MVFRTRAYGGGVFCASHDGDFRPRPFQRYPRHACFRPVGPGRDFRRGHDRSCESGQAKRRESEDFLDVEKHTKITFAGKQVELVGADQAVLTGELTIRGITRTVPLRVHYLGQWQTPWWEDGVDKGPKSRAGFAATTTINRDDFDVSWNPH